MARFSGLSILFCAGMMFVASQAQAGFEFTAPPSAAPVADTAGTMDMDAPMPIVPTPAVTAEPLAPMNTPEAVAAAPEKSADPVYIRRQRTTASFPPPANEPMDSAALLNATENMQTVALNPSDLAQKPAAKSGKLVINPYPLESTATHNAGGMGTLSVEHAMMEEGGTLRPVATPGGGKAQGLRARAQMTSRYDPGARYMDRSQMAADAAIDASLASNMLTPIPGGEGEPLKRIEGMPLKPPSNLVHAQPVKPATPPAVAPKPAAPAPLIPARASVMEDPAPQYTEQANAAPVTGGYTEAVGFGRELPLALALSQVVPPEYSYAFGKDVNVGTTVSWQGGKPWNEVLNDMLAPNGMRAVIDGNKVVIQSANT